MQSIRMIPLATRLIFNLTKRHGKNYLNSRLYQDENTFILPKREICSIYMSRQKNKNHHPLNKNNFRKFKCNYQKKEISEIPIKFYSSGHEGKTIKFMLSDIGEGITEVVIREWFVKVGDVVKQFDSICEVQSDKASVTITSRYDGVISKIYHDVESVAKVGSPLVEIITDISENSSPVPTSFSATTQTILHEAEEKVKPQELQKKILDDKNALSSIPTLPAVRRMAKEQGVDLKLVKATGKDGRVTKEDLINYLHDKDTAKTSLLSASDDMEDKRIRLKGVRLAMYKTMEESLKIPHFSLSEEIDVTKLSQFIRNLKHENFSGGEAKIGHLAFIIKACSMALKEFPLLNGSVERSEDGVFLIQKAAHNIGIAVDTDDGLVVPNIKNVQNLTLTHIAKELARLKDTSVHMKLTPQDVADGTFSISNIGSIGGVRGYPLIMPPQVAIGAVGRIRKVPKFDNQGQIVAVEILDVVWSGDHRVIDGATMTKFSNLWKSYLENISKMTLSLH